MAATATPSARHRRTPPGATVIGSAPMSHNKNNLEALYLAHQSPLRRFVARRLPHSEEAEDIIQETFLRLANESGAPARAFARARSPVAYLERMACNLAVDKRRSAASRHTDPGPATGTEAEWNGPGPERQLLTERRLARLRQAVEQLPPKRRQVFVLHKYRQLTYREVAAHLDISLGMVEKHMSRALAQLDDLLSEDTA